MTGRIRDIGQNLLMSSFETGNSSSHSYRHTFFFIAFLEEAFITNIIIMVIIKFIIMIYINNNALKIKGKGKGHPCTDTEALYSPYGL